MYRAMHSFFLEADGLGGRYVYPTSRRLLFVSHLPSSIGSDQVDVGQEAPGRVPFFFLFLSRALEEPALAGRGDGEVEGRLADAQVPADPFLDLGVFPAYLLRFEAGPGRFPVGGLMLVFVSLFLSFLSLEVIG